MKAKELDRKFDAGEDVLEYLNLSKAKRTNQAKKRVNVDFPIGMIQALDRKSKRWGFTRQSIIKIWLAERLERGAAGR